MCKQGRHAQDTAPIHRRSSRLQAPTLAAPPREMPQGRPRLTTDAALPSQTKRLLLAVVLCLVPFVLSRTPLAPTSYALFCPCSFAMAILL